MNVFVIDVHISKPNCFRNSSTDRVIDEVSLNDEFVMKMFIAVVVKLVMLVISFNFLRILMRQNTIIINFLYLTKLKFFFCDKKLEFLC